MLRETQNRHIQIWRTHSYKCSFNNQTGENETITYSIVHYVCWRQQTKREMAMSHDIKLNQKNNHYKTGSVTQKNRGKGLT